MTVNVADRTVRYTGDGVTTTFAITYQFYDVDVYVDGELQIDGDDYTLTGGAGSTGSCVFAQAPISNALVVIVGNTPASQTANFQNFDDAPAGVYEAAVDKAVLLAADIRERLKRSIRAPIHGPDIPEFDFAANPNTLFYVDDDGNAVLADATEIEAVSELIAELDEAVEEASGHAEDAAADAATATNKAAAASASELAAANSAAAALASENAAEAAELAAQDAQAAAELAASNAASAATTVVNAHINDTSDAHAASAIGFTPAGNVVATDVQAAVEEVSSDLDDHIDDTEDAHPASAISVTPAGNVTATDVQAAIEELDTLAAGGGLPSGTRLLFPQASAPTGWTQITTHNDKALRVVSGTPGSGGSTAFSTVFAARTISVSELPNHNITITDPGHIHTVNFANQATGAGGTTNKPQLGPPTTNSGSATTGITAAFGNAARGGAQTAMDFAVAYVDVMIAEKD